MTEQLKAEIEVFKKECLQLWFCERLADSYTNTSLFDHFILKEDRVFWMKAQARQLWDFWRASKTQAMPDGYVPVAAIRWAVIAGWELSSDGHNNEHCNANHGDLSCQFDQVTEEILKAAQENL